MKRDLNELSKRNFDVLVVGGGIHGVQTAWDAVLRGLSVALIERGDFGSGTSQNSLKVIHGGLRYLQDLNLARVRKMAKEQAAWVEIAPHLVHPIPCLTPTFSKLPFSRSAMRIALGLNDLIRYSSKKTRKEKQLPTGKIIEVDELNKLLPGYDAQGTTGAAIWYDALLHNSERLLFSIITSACRAGLTAANYIEAVEFLQKGTQVVGVRAKDRISGQNFQIRAKVTINCSGAWINRLFERTRKTGSARQYQTSVALNLITQQIWTDYAAGLQSRQQRQGQQSRMIFFLPWRKYSLIGTQHIHWSSSPDSFRITEDLITRFLEEINSTHPDLKLSTDDVLHVQWGFLPALSGSVENDPVRLVRDFKTIDHSHEDGIGGLISLVGVKYTTSRAGAQTSVDLAVRKLGMKVRPCTTDITPVAGGQIEHFEEFLQNAEAKRPVGTSADILKHLVYTYGSEYKSILEYMNADSSLGERISEGTGVIKAEIVHAVRHEMVHTLSDVVQRRTELGSAGFPGLAVLRTCADLMGNELGWSEEQKNISIEEVCRAYPITTLTGTVS